MTKLALTPLMVSLAVVYATAQAPTTQSSALTPAAKATLKDAQGKTLGEATVRDSPAGVLVKLDLQNVPPGTHAFHIHAVGKCDPPDFMTAGGHFNPGMMKHGLMATGGPHAGDMPNLFVPSDGKLSVEVLDTNVTVAPGAKSLFDADGSALVLHATADDYTTDPAGNAGGRIACGILSK
jgi:Cu-Zn family superoxide dismutase